MSWAQVPYSLDGEPTNINHPRWNTLYQQHPVLAEHVTGNPSIDRHLLRLLTGEAFRFSAFSNIEHGGTLGYRRITDVTSHNSLLLACSHSGHVKGWDLRTRTASLVLPKISRGAFHLEKISENELLVGGNTQVLLWDLRNPERCVREFNEDRQPPVDVFGEPGWRQARTPALKVGNRVLTACTVWDFNTGNQVYEFNFPDRLERRGDNFYWYKGERMAQFNPDNKAPIHHWDGTCALFENNQTILGKANGDVVFVNNNGVEVSRTHALDNRVSCLGQRPDRLYAGDAFGNVKVWNTASSQLVRSYKVRKGLSELTLFGESLLCTSSQFVCYLPIDDSYRRVAQDIDHEFSFALVNPRGRVIKFDANSSTCCGPLLLSVGGSTVRVHHLYRGNQVAKESWLFSRDFSKVGVHENQVVIGTYGGTISFAPLEHISDLKASSSSRYFWSLQEKVEIAPREDDGEPWFW